MNDTIRLTDDEIRSGIVLEIQAAQAAARLQAIRDMSLAYAATLRRKYGLGDEYELTDWIDGFVRKIEV